MERSLQATLTDERAAFLARASKLLGASLDFETTLRSVARAALPELADWCAVDLVVNDTAIQRLAFAHRDPEREAVAREIAQAHAPDLTSLGGVADVLRSGHADFVEPNDPLVVELGAASGIVAPLMVGQRVLGALNLGAQRRYSQADLELAAELADRCALAVHSAGLYRAALQATELRDVFLATISHDLKNPLATIGAQAQMLRRQIAPLDDSRTTERLRNGIQRIEASVERMSRMIDLVLDVTRLELGGHLPLERRRMDLVEAARRVAAEHQEHTSEHRMIIAGETSLVGEWDLARIERVLDNLIGNAIKYSPDGGSVAIVCVKEVDNENSWAILSVKDQGVGIGPGDVPHVFERFRRAANVGAISGTGIGLATVRDVVQEHGGTITVDSTEGVGSTFTIRLPLTCSAS